MAAARIMIVEDEQITASDIAETLQHLGYSVTAVVASGAEAIRKAEESAPDLVLMDIRIKGEIDGIETAQEMRQRFDIPVVYLTAHADEHTLARAKLAEPLGYLVKPFQQPELQASIQMALHKHQMDRQARAREDWLAATLSAIEEGIIGVDSMGVVSYLNPAAEEWTGWKQAEARGQNIAEVFKVIDSHDRQPLENLVTPALREGVVSELPHHALLMARNGMERPVAGSVAPIRDPQGRVAGVVLAFGNLSSGPLASPVSAATGVSEDIFQAGNTRIVVESAEMRRLMKFAGRIAGSGVTTILIQGESGTGKDVLAKFLHYASSRRERPFVAINCAAIPEMLLESELFGHEKGAFTDARSLKKGVLELAHGGSVFLDEIGELQLHLQAKLLRVLEDQCFRRVGGVRDINVDVRVIASTNRNLGEILRKGQFREDLYYRLNVIQIYLPPLREHKEDVLPLANYFVDLYNRKFRSNFEGVSPEAAELLLAHDWPGNVRELRNAIERAMVLEEDSVLHPASLAIGTEGLESASPQEESPSRGAAQDSLSLEDAEKSMLARALRETGGNQTQAARKLGISRDTLRYRIKKFGLK